MAWCKKYGDFVLVRLDAEVGYTYNNTIVNTFKITFENTVFNPEMIRGFLMMFGSTEIIETSTTYVTIRFANYKHASNLMLNVHLLNVHGLVAEPSQHHQDLFFGGLDLYPDDILFRMYDFMDFNSLITLRGTSNTQKHMVNVYLQRKIKEIRVGTGIRSLNMSYPSYKEVLAICGPLIETAFLANITYEKFVEVMLACTNLTTLVIENVHFHDVRAAYIFPILDSFDMLTEISFVNVVFGERNLLFLLRDRLERITFDHCRNLHGHIFSRIFLPKLVGVNLRRGDSLKLLKSGNFINAIPNLGEYLMFSERLIDCVWRTHDATDEYIEILEVYDLIPKENLRLDSTHYNNLRTLCLTADVPLEVSAWLKEFNKSNITELILRNPVLDRDFFVELKNWKNLTSLKIIGGLFREINIIKNVFSALTELRSIQIEKCPFYNNKDEFAAIIAQNSAFKFDFF